MSWKKKQKVSKKCRRPEHPIGWPTGKDDSDFMREIKQKCWAVARENPNEEWMWDKLRATRHRWSRQAIWGFRVFDFFCHELGVAVEVDGASHDPVWDATRDRYNLQRSAIVVLRARNRNERDAERVLSKIETLESWTIRRITLGLDRKSKTSRGVHAEGKCGPSCPCRRSEWFPQTLDPFAYRWAEETEIQESLALEEHT